MDSLNLNAYCLHIWILHIQKDKFIGKVLGPFRILWIYLFWAAAAIFLCPKVLCIFRICKAIFVHSRFCTYEGAPNEEGWFQRSGGKNRDFDQHSWFWTPKWMQELFLWYNFLTLFIKWRKFCKISVLIGGQELVVTKWLNLRWNESMIYIFDAFF